MKRLTGFALFFWLAATSFPALGQAPVFDNSGNGLLNGTFYFREVIYFLADSQGDIAQGYSVYGNITFDGNGNYMVSGAALFDSGVGSQPIQNVPGTYRISASGFGYMDGPLSNNTVFGVVSNGIFVGSSTEGGPDGTFNDIMIAAKLASPAPTNASFRGTYQLASLDFPISSPPATSPAYARNALFQVNADGIGNLGTVSLTGYILGLGSQVVNQNATAVKYFFSNGAANVTFPGNQLTNSTLIVGTRYLYFSADGNFVFGGSPNGLDMIVGFKTGTDAPNFSGLYYQTGIDELSGVLDTFYGSLTAGGGQIREHERLLSMLSGFGGAAFDFTGSGAYNVASNGTYTDSGVSYVVGPGGNVRIGIGIGPNLSLSVAVKGPSLSGSGVFLDPTGVVNGGSFAPFTAGIARGELISLFGTNLAPNTVVASQVPFPPMLGGVQVLINGRQAPIYFVSSGQISVVVPYLTELTAAGIQVINNGVASNTVVTFVGLTTPGIFTKPAGGIGLGAILHQDFTLVTEASPAQIGETVSIYLTGLGDVLPSIMDGAAGPVSPLSMTMQTIGAFVGGVQGTVTYSGLAPQLAGLYQLNVTIPAGVAGGDATLAVSGPDSYTSLAIIPIASSSAPATSAAPAARKPGAFTRPDGAPPVRSNRPSGRQQLR